MGFKGAAPLKVAVRCFSPAELIQGRSEVRTHRGHVKVSWSLSTSMAGVPAAKHVSLTRQGKLRQALDGLG